MAQGTRLKAANVVQQVVGPLATAKEGGHWRMAGHHALGEDRLKATIAGQAFQVSKPRRARQRAWPLARDGVTTAAVRLGQGSSPDD